MANMCMSTTNNLAGMTPMVISDIVSPAMDKLALAQMEATNQVTLITPQPGYVIKTSIVNAGQEMESLIDGLGKLFINVCTEDSGLSTSNCLVPTLTRPRRDMDKAGQECLVLDALFHPDVMRNCQDCFRFKEQVNSSALDNIEKTFNIQLDRQGVRYPKLRFKGSIPTAMIKRPLEEEDQVELVDSRKKEPKYCIKYETKEDQPRPSMIILEITLPEMSSANGIDLDVLEHEVTLESNDYKLVLSLDYPVHEEQGSAKFNKADHCLQVTLPVKAAKECVGRVASTDSGIGLDFQELPPFTSNSYEGLLVFTIKVANVVTEDLERVVIPDKGYQLCFHSSGAPTQYGFCVAFNFDGEANIHQEELSLDNLEVEVWDKNVLMQLSIPYGASSYQVGSSLSDLNESTPLVQFRAVKNNYLNFDAKQDDNDDDRDHEESQDSIISMSQPGEGSRFLVSKSGSILSRKRLRGILKRSRCFSESQAQDMQMVATLQEKCEEKKCVKFNEVVQRQVYRSNSSILGQKLKNLKKAGQKRRKAAEKRRMSEGDASSNQEEEDSDAEEALASFKKSSEDFSRAIDNKFLNETNSDLIFSLEEC